MGCGYGIRDPGSEIRDSRSGIRDPRSGIRDPGSGINLSLIPDPDPGIKKDLRGGVYDLHITLTTSGL
jgi:hypothetical protein